MTGEITKLIAALSESSYGYGRFVGANPDFDFGEVGLYEGILAICLENEFKRIARLDSWRAGIAAREEK